MRINYKLTLVSCIALVLIIFSSAPFSFGDSNVTLVQNNSNGQQSSTTATCTLTGSVTHGNSLMMTLDAAFIDHTTISISDSLGNSWVAFAEILNSASTWAQAWEAQNIAHGGSSDVINVTYTDISGRGSYQTSCAEFAGNLNFTQVGGLIVGSASCNNCTLLLLSTLSYGGHAINYFTGWSDSSTATNTGFSYIGLCCAGGANFLAKSGSDTCQTISGSSNCILAFHAESDIPAFITGTPPGVSGVQIFCSPACSQTPVFALTYYTNCISGLCATITSTITGFLVPNFVNGVSSLSWLYFLLVVLVPMAEIIGVITMERQAVLDRHAIIFIFLALLLLDSIFGVMLNVVTVAMPFVFGTLFGIYLWRGRG